MPATTKSARICETCGSPIEMTSSGDLGCMVCLLDAALDRDAEQSEAAFASALDQLGAYTIERHVDGSAWELGHGAMGVTYRAIDKVLDRPVALKIINTDLGSHRAEARERFMREARAAAALRHPNVATVYQFGIREETGQFFYAMELVDGETLEERVRRLGPLDVLTTIDMALQVTAALAAAEERGLVHRDLKPGNLMLVSHDGERAPSTATPAFARLRRGRQRRGYSAPLAVAPTRSGRRGADRNDEVGRALRARQKRTAQRAVPTIKVIDFGVAKAVSEKTNAMALTHGGFVGTPAFASPEQFTNAAVDVRSDIYSLGVTLWYLLTVQMPFSGRTIQEIRDARRSKPLPVEQLKAARVPPRFVELLTSMLAIEPAARPAGARELSAKLQKIRASITDRSKIAVGLGLAAVTLILGVSAFFVFRSARVHLVAPEKSIAVLPFENLSRDPDNAYFADGIQEEVLTRLTSIADLKVISRSSTQRYQSKPRNLGEIAKQLGVANILEGSVQKAADQVRVTVQLVNAQTDSHLWADTYDRKLTDIFGVESEIAKGIAESLQAKLTGREEQALAVKPTNNPEAYDAYLRGRAFQARGPNVTDLGEKAIGFYERAVQLDPNFALAWAWLARARAAFYFHNYDTTSAQRDAVKEALENALKLQPNLPETQLALGYYQYQVLGDYGRAKTSFRLVSKMLGGSSEVPYALGLVARHEGNWDESVAYFEQGLAVDPRNVELLRATARTYVMLRQFPAALRLYDRALDIIPNDPQLMSFKANVYQDQGNLQEAARLLSEIHAPSPWQDASAVKHIQLRLERNHGEAVRLLQTHLAQFHFAFEAAKRYHQVRLAFAQRFAGDTAGAKVTAEQARNTLEPLCKSEPTNPRFAKLLSLSYAALGNKDLALKEAERTITLVSSAKDRLGGPDAEEVLAVIQAMFGENDRAIPTLSRLLQTPYTSWLYGGLVPITPALLRLDPFWDPLRGDPAFQKLCEEKQL
jgi:serine/threonine protein kinase/tetratricopeptide (TPR) repeat protein